MYFFKADISSFDDEAETVFITPDRMQMKTAFPLRKR